LEETKDECKEGEMLNDEIKGIDLTLSLRFEDGSRGSPEDERFEKN